MAAKIGILGETTTVTGSTQTVYTVPADKAARVRVLMASEGGTSPANNIRIGSPGTENTIHMGQATGVDTWTGLLDESSPNPALSFEMSVIGFQNKNGGLALSTDDGTVNYAITPFPVDYYLSTGDTVIFRNYALLTDVLFQVMGVEDDA